MCDVGHIRRQVFWLVVCCSISYDRKKTTATDETTGAPEAELAEVGVLLHKREAQNAQQKAPGGSEEDEGEEPPHRGDEELAWCVRGCCWVGGWGRWVRGGLIRGFGLCVPTGCFSPSPGPSLRRRRRAAVYQAGLRRPRRLGALTFVVFGRVFVAGVSQSCT